MSKPALALALSACALLAACSTQAGNSGVPAARYLVCYDLVGPCTGATPKHEPASLLMSGDGSLWAKDITWTGWGTATATGSGTAEADNCEPDCAQGTFSGHPVRFTLTRPEPWHQDMIYTHAAYSIPSLNQHNAFVTGLPGPLPAASPRSG